MSVFDKIIAAVAPPESDEARAEAREKARAAASSGDWLSQILEHHLGIERGFAEVKSATRRRAPPRSNGSALCSTVMREPRNR